MESKEKFINKIYEYYNKLSKEIIPKELLNDLILKIADNQFKFYKNCFEKYPKSRKRYSEFKVKDLETSSTYFFILDYFRSKEIKNESILKYSKNLFKMTNEEFLKFDYYKRWYEDK